jgi:hypothetical protein
VRRSCGIVHTLECFTFRASSQGAGTRSTPTRRAVKPALSTGPATRPSTERRPRALPLCGQPPQQPIAEDGLLQAPGWPAGHENTGLSHDRHASVASTQSSLRPGRPLCRPAIRGPEPGQRTGSGAHRLTHRGTSSPHASGSGRRFLSKLWPRGARRYVRGPRPAGW